MQSLPQLCINLTQESQARFSCKNLMQAAPFACRVVLLVVETGCVLLSCMAWEYVLAKLANAEHIRRFSVFLALPSATIRAMALKQTRVCWGSGL